MRTRPHPTSYAEARAIYGRASGYTVRLDDDHRLVAHNQVPGTAIYDLHIVTSEGTTVARFTDPMQEVG